MENILRFKKRLKKLISEFSNFLDEFEENKIKQPQKKKEKTTTNIKQGEKYWNEERLNYLREHCELRNKLLAEYFGCTPRAVTTARYTYNIKNPKLEEVKTQIGIELNKRKDKVWDAEKLELLREKSHLSAVEASELFSVSVYAINGARRRYKIPGPSRGGSKREFKSIFITDKKVEKTSTKTKNNIRAVRLKPKEKIFETKLPTGYASLTKSVIIDNKTTIQIGIDVNEEQARKKYFENRARLEQLKKSGR